MSVVVKSGFTKKNRFAGEVIECDSCGCTFVIEESDVTKPKTKSKDVFTISCPECNFLVELYS